MERINLRPNNPYHRGYITEFEEGDRALDRPRLKYNPSVEDEQYTVKEDDTLESIAFLKYEDSKEWHIIADANNIINPWEFDSGDWVGIDIVIPYFDKVQAAIR